MSNSKKFSENFTHAEASTFLSNLAQDVEKSKIELQGHSIDWKKIRKLKLTFYPHELGLTLRVKLEKARTEPENKESYNKTKDRKNALKKLKAGMKFKRSGLKGRVKKVFRGLIADNSGAGERVRSEAVQPAPSPAAPGGNTGYKILKKRMKKNFAGILRNARNYQLPPEKDLISFIQDSETMVQYPGYGDDFYLKFKDKVREMHESFEQNDSRNFFQKCLEVNQIQKDCHRQYK
ncbi:GAK system XXXCH domain-containing protein [Desulfonatronospira sp.]|uniref:GAK system XXXCH domain-containing protein n=1 Tax=Desulfonatronospira sp. TaxID=1962951 RepID=UPI0025B84165|nr:GAK system XXXCH domain-containing protein [Desulfonatronospira sp.]